ncbi:hypothetical protein [Nocardioides sp.]|uniref:hypothetical protein n=1 Tax=Nocardioides sp. TaxID=35761 RepID=UPI00286CA875|nr:hypothetical protein [Nocardioides sp.]
MKRVKGFLKRRVADAVLVVVWLVVLFNCVQLSRLEGETTTRMAVSYGAMVLIGLVATFLWWRGRRRARP